MKALICSFCLLFAPVVGACTDTDDPIFKYRCAEYAYQAGDYKVAQEFYYDILPHCHASSHLGLLCTTGLLDTMLSMGDWLSADVLTSRYDFASFQHLFGYDSLLLRECFLLVKNNHFAAAMDLLLSIDFLALNNEDLAWYHCLYALILSQRGDFHDAKSEFDMAFNCCSSDTQLAVVEAIKTQCEVSLNIDSDVNQIAQSLENKIKHYDYGSRALPFLKQYILLFTSAHHSEKVKDDLVDTVLKHVSNVEEVYEILLYRAIYSGLSSMRGMKFLEDVLLGTFNRNTQLLALKLVTSVDFDEDELGKIINLLDSVFEKSSSDWLKRQTLLAEMAITIKHNMPHICQNIANRYISIFDYDKYFAEIYELLAYLSVEEEDNEYRLSVHYLDKLRVSAKDDTAKLAITLQIADAFFNNHDFKLASEMYDEVLALDKAKKFQDVIENQVISDIAQQNFDQAKEHLSRIENFSPKKCEATLLLIKAFRKNERFAEGLEYIDSIDNSRLPKIFRLKLYLQKSRLLLQNHQLSQAILYVTKVLDALPDGSITVATRDLVSHALFIKGLCSLKLHDYEKANSLFKRLRTGFKNSKYAALSMIKEAEYWQTLGDNKRALELLEQCDNERYLAYVQYRSAEILRADGKIGEALRLFDLIIRENGQTDLAMLARIAQGDTLRLIGQFAGADAIYDRVLSETHDDDYLRYTSLAHARCLLAQRNKKASVVDQALIELDKLYLARNTDLDWCLEVTAEYCLALKLRKDFAKLHTIAFDALKNLSQNESRFTQKTAFWALQILYLLHDTFDLTDVHPYLLESIEDMIIKYQGLL